MTTTWTLLFEPLGVLMFRDHRPFDAGRDGIARSQFPRPSVFRGAVRTALFNAAGADFRAKRFGLGHADAALLGDADNPEAFAIRGPLLARRAQGDHPFEYLLPWPADLADVRSGFEVLTPTRQPGVSCFRWRGGPAEPLPYEGPLPLARGERRKPPPEARYLTPGGAELYAGAREGALKLEQERHYVSQASLMRIERRVGLARVGGRLTAAQGMLYTLLTHRMAENARFAVEVDVEGEHAERLRALLRQLDGQSVRLGGQSGHARVELHERCLAPALGRQGSTSKLWAWTPALRTPHSSPWRCALGEPIVLGGFDMARRTPRPLRPAFDRGAVLHYASRASAETALAEAARAHEVPSHSYAYGHWSTVE